MTEVVEILDFWFGDLSTEESHYSQRRNLWFRKSAQVDETIRERFRDTYERAAAGQLDDWQSASGSSLALVIVLDQFSRNLFRGQPQAFATDAQALAIAKGAIARQFDLQLPPLQRMFFYMPFEHSESLEDQHQSVKLFAQLAAVAPELNDPYDYAIRHRDVIARFERFPHRNQILGRASTADEVEFLKQPGSSF
jgi:uncharacterized protein (DUF924 family)